MSTVGSRLSIIGLAALLALILWTCSPSRGVWFKGSLEEAMTRASTENTLVMADFFTDWCSWCKRMDSDTFNDSDVQAELETLVPIKLDAEGDGAEAAERFGVDSFPTVVFINGEGHEVDRILGYRAPDDFIKEIHRIRAGDTFMACLSRLDEEPADLEALERAVSGLLDRLDTGAAIERIDAFHTADDGSREAECRSLMFTARHALHKEAYSRAIWEYKRDWQETPTAPDTLGTSHLHALLQIIDAVEDDATALREARHDDAREILALLPAGSLGPETSLSAGRFAFDTGHYDRAEELYRGWFDRRQRGEQVEYLNEVAWNLYLMDRDLDAALDLAREAYKHDPDPNVGDTLARLLYRAGDPEEALRIQNEAVETAQNRPMADSLRAAAEVMAEGGDLGDMPDFESYPGSKRR